MFAHFRGVCYFYYFLERIFDNGVRKTRRNIGDLRTLFLRLLNARIHKNGTA